MKSKAGKYPDEEAVLAEIRLRKSFGQPLNSNGLQTGRHRDSALLGSGIRYFGSWQNAVDRAGLDYAEVRLTAVSRSLNP